MKTPLEAAKELLAEIEKAGGLGEMEGEELELAKDVKLLAETILAMEQPVLTGTIQERCECAACWTVRTAIEHKTLRPLDL